MRLRHLAIVGTIVVSQSLRATSVPSHALKGIDSASVVAGWPMSERGDAIPTTARKALLLLIETRLRGAGLACAKNCAANLEVSLREVPSPDTKVAIVHVALYLREDVTVTRKGAVVLVYRAITWHWDTVLTGQPSAVALLAREWLLDNAMVEFLSAWKQANPD